MVESAPQDPLAQFDRHRFLVLETYRRDGTAVPTPLLFVVHHDVLYMRTPATTYKVKRIRHTPRVRIAPSDWRGQPKGSWISGKATLHDAAELEWVNELSKRKYGLLKWLIDFRSRRRSLSFIVIALQPELVGPAAGHNLTGTKNVSTLLAQCLYLFNLLDRLR